MNFFKKIFAKKSIEPASFWSWLEANIGLCLDLSDMRAYGKALDMCRAAYGEVTVELQGGPSPQVILSADGILERIPLVMRAFAEAPQTDAFTVVAFRQPKDDQFCLDVRGHKVTLENTLVYYRGPHESGSFDVKLYLPIPASASEEDYLTVGYLVLDHGLGEYVVMTKLRPPKFLHFSLAEPNAIPLSEFRARFLADAPTSP